MKYNLFHHSHFMPFLIFFLQDEIVNGLQDAIEQALLSSAQIQTFIRNCLPTPITFKNPKDLNIHNDQSIDINSKDLHSSQVVYRPNEKVRIDLREQQLERFLSPQSNYMNNNDNNMVCSKLKGLHNNSLKKSIGEMSPDIEVDSDEADEILKSNLLQENGSLNYDEFDWNKLVVFFIMMIVYECNYSFLK